MQIIHYCGWFALKNVYVSASNTRQPKYLLSSSRYKFWLTPFAVRAWCTIATCQKRIHVSCWHALDLTTLWRAIWFTEVEPLLLGDCHLLGCARKCECKRETVHDTYNVEITSDNDWQFLKGVHLPVISTLRPSAEVQNHRPARVHMHHLMFCPSTCKHWQSSTTRGSKGFYRYRFYSTRAIALLLEGSTSKH